SYLAVLCQCAKEALSYAFDPELAQVGGVPAGAVHYGLLSSIAGVVVVGAPLVGVVLVTALLVLPGATGALAGGGLRRVYAVSLAAALVAVMAAVSVAGLVEGLPLGPLIVLALVIEFSIAAAVARAGRG